MRQPHIPGNLGPLKSYCRFKTVYAQHHSFDAFVPLPLGHGAPREQARAVGEGHGKQRRLSSAD
jgi:hypothetical protein